jgi:hypothetical protein
MLLLLCLVLALFSARVGSARLARFFRFLFYCFWLLASGWQYLGGAYFGYTIIAVFARFVAGFLLFFLVCCFLAVVTRGKYRRPGPCGHSHAFFACPPIPDWSTAPIPTIHGHPCAFGLVCVFVPSAHVDFRP